MEKGGRLRRGGREDEAGEFAFQGGSNLQEQKVVSDGGNELKAHRETVGSETAGNGDSRDARKVGRTVVPQQKSACGILPRADASFLFADERSGDGSSWNNEGVHLRLGHGSMQ